MIKIVTDSTVDLSKDTINELGITIVPLSTTVDGVSYVDGIDLTSEGFMKLMATANELPKTSQPPVGKFVEVFDELGKDGSEILAINLTSKMSGTHNSAVAASNISESKVTCWNSQYISHAMSYQIREAVEMAKKGFSVEAILERLDKVRECTSLFIVVDRLENLVKGGRVSKSMGFLGSILNIKPIASLSGGEYTPVAKVRNYSQVIKFLAKQFAEDIKGKTIKYVSIAHADGLEHANNLCEAIKEYVKKEQIYIHHTCSTISSHTGPGAISFTYMVE